MKKTLQVTIESLELRNKGISIDQEDRLLLNFTAIYPKADCTSLVSTKTLKSNEDLPSDIDFAADYEKRIIFKTDFQEESQINIDVISVDNPNKVETFIRGLFGAAATVGLSTLTGGISNVILGAAVSTTGKALVSQLQSTDAMKYQIGSASIPFNVNTLPAEGTSFSAELKVPEDITVQSGGRHGPRGKGSPTITSTLFKAGDSNGKIRLFIKPLS